MPTNTSTPSPTMHASRAGSPASPPTATMPLIERVVLWYLDRVGHDGGAQRATG
ncbi:hypothetical protein LEP48_02190 [Isoptericola sp. NEAU-Y5]|uniref:Uncharacterized protein n=1 Tax=Isoptericola luteus TaxID=2879484 RepID=A0ABS7ZAS4_9MICO|nr:hypothetical protein [Isoptericola sp. NEAU-Y5]MCA5892158.1 hypothetical protein [Isoptericola sp. NEAU-Y5]